MNKKHKFFLKSGILSLFAISFAISLMINYQQSMAAWTGDCALFIDGGSLTVTAGQTCNLSGSGTATDVTVDGTGTLDLSSATLSVSGPVDIDGDLDIDGTSTLNVTSGDLTVANGGVVDNNGTINVDTLDGQTTRVEDAASNFNNYNQINTRRLYVGQNPTEGGTYTNTGITNITENAPADTLNIYGGEIYNNNTSVTTSFSWVGRAWINGISDVNQGRFENSGVVDGGQRAMNIVNYGKIDLKNSANSRFVLNNSGCATLGDPEVGRIYLSGLDATHTVSFEIEDGAFLGIDGITVGSSPLSDDDLTNNGVIRKIDTAGTDLNCPVLLTTNGTSTITNNKDIDIHNGAFTLFDNSTVTNNASGNITGEPSGSSQIESDDIGTNFDNYGSVNMQNILLGFSGGPYNGGTYTAKTGSTNNFEDDVVVGDTGVNGGTLTIESGTTLSTNNLNLNNNGVINLDPTSVLDVTNDFNMRDTATFTNDGEINVGNITLIIDDGTILTNNGTFNTYKMNVGALALDGGEYDNYGVTNITYSSMSDDVSLNIIEGTVTNNNTDLGVVSFSYDAKAFIEGTVAEQAVFRNYGLVDAGISDVAMTDYALLDLQDGRFVLNSGGCYLGGPNNGSVKARSTTAPGDSLINIEAGATLSVDYLELGWFGNNSKGQINNNGGTIDKIDLTGAPLDCPVNIRNNIDSIINNGTGSLIDLREGRIYMSDSTEFNNDAGATINGINDSGIRFESIGAVFNQSGDIDVYNIEVKSTDATHGAIFNAENGSTTTVMGISVGNQSNNLGGQANINAGAQLTASTIVLAEGYAEIHADGQIDGGALLIMPGQADGSTLVNLNDDTPDESYDFDVLFMNTPQATYTSTLNIPEDVEVNINSAIQSPFNSDWVTSVIGGEPNGGDVFLNLNGNLNVADYPAEAADFIISENNGTVTIGPNGFLNVDEEDGQFIITAPDPYGLIDNSDDPINEGVDIESECIVDGNIDLNNRFDCKNLIHVQENGDVDIAHNAVVNVEGSETIVDGAVELDGTWNAGNLTVNGPGGWIHSGGDDEVETTTNFLINADNLTVNSGGKIASDGVSSAGFHVNGPGSYGGEGEGRGPASCYGEVKLDELDIPPYGEAGFNAGVDAKGGGGVRLKVLGNITIDGEISSDGADSTDASGGTGSGGSVIIVHKPTDPDAFFTGSGTITANSGGSLTPGVPVGGGGRIVIDSSLIDGTDFNSYDFGENSGTITANPGVNSNDTEYGAAGTIVYLGDVHNPRGTLIVDQLGFVDPVLEETQITNVGDYEFDRVEVLGGGNVTWKADPPAPPAVCYQTSGAITYNPLNCDDYKWPDMPQTLFVNTRETGAQGVDLFQEPGYQTEDGVNNEPLNVQDLNPVFSFIYKNPVDPGTPITQIQIQVDDDSDFSSPIWDYLKTDLTQNNGGDVTDGTRTQDITYNEDQGGTALVYGDTYFIRSRFVNASGLWSHANYNNQYKFKIVPTPPPPPPGGGGGGGSGSPGPGGGSAPTFPSAPAEEPAAEAPAEASAEEPAAEAPSAPAEEPAQPSEPSAEAPAAPAGKVKVPVKKRPAAGPAPLAGPIPGCTRGDVTERILNEFNLFELLAEKDAKCSENWQHCMLPFLIHSSHDASSESYYPDVFEQEDYVGDSNPIPPVMPVDEELVSDSNPMPPVMPVAAIEFATRNAMVQGYYEEEGSPFRPFDNMSRIEILKLLNWIVGQQWIYYEEYIAQIGGEQNLDTNLWWHNRYYTYACDLGLVPCDPISAFEPEAVCSVEWLDNMIQKYKNYYEDQNLADQKYADTDNDTIYDQDENNIFYTDPEIEDTDNDTLDDGEEINIHNTNPLIEDTDYDGLTDGEEINIHKTNPTKPDTDNDGTPDGLELEYGTDPNNASSKPSDTDNDGIPDEWESQYNIDPKDGIQDTDLDGLSDLLEFINETDPINPDTDGDGLKDSEEVLLYATDPLEFTSLDELGVKITNIREGMILTDKWPMIQGFAPQSDMEIMVILRNEFGHELVLGKTFTDENKAFVFTSEFELQDGSFYLIAKGLDVENGTVINSPLINVTLDSSLQVEEPKPERLGQTIISEEVLLEELEVEVDDQMPTLYGRTGRNNRVIAVWHSVLGVSSIVADLAGGEFSIPSPEEMPLGKHKVTVYSIRDNDQAVSKDVAVNFNVTEPKITITHEVAAPRKGGIPWWIWLALGIAIVGIVGFIKLRKKPVEQSEESEEQASSTVEPVRRSATEPDTPKQLKETSMMSDTEEPESPAPPETPQ